MNLEQIEAYYDTVPRIAATTEEVGPFTLFLSVPGTGWDFYARPRLGLSHEYTAEDVRRVLSRQEELRVTRAIEWVDEVTELMGIGVLPMARKQGRGGSIIRALVRAARSRGVTTAFLSAGSDDAASVYRAVGFERVGTACILEVPDSVVNHG